MSQDRFLDNGEPSPGDITVPDVVNFESNALDLPAPEIDLGGGAPDANADKPLGPRRLALLREQMQQHAKDLAQNQSDDPEHVDEDLAQQQMRMARLASRAALSSEEDRLAAERAMDQGPSVSDDAQPMTASIPADQVRRRDLRGERSQVPSASDADADAGPDPESEPVEVADAEESEVDRAQEAESAQAAQPQPEAAPASQPAPASEAAAAADADANGVEPEPAQPVSALDAQGLELMEPEDYRQSSHLKTIILVMAAVVLLAVAVVVLMILL